jgi:hypothetical protein
MRTKRLDGRVVRHVARVLGPVLLSVATASAQARPAAKPPGPPRFELGAGVSWLGGYGLGARDATLTGNAGTPGGSIVLFRADSEVGAAAGLDLQFGYRVSRRVVAEAVFAYSRPELRTSIGSDYEQAADVIASETLSQYTVEGAVRVSLFDAARSGRRWSPFVSGSVGYLRQLSSDAFAVETGTVFRVGAGLTWMIGSRPRGLARAWGARADGRVNWRTGGIDTEDRTRTWPSVSGGMFVRF